MFWSNVRRLRHKSRQSRRASRLAGYGRNASFETLDPRRVLAASVVFDAGTHTLTIDGTDNPDVIALAPSTNGQNVQVTINSLVFGTSPLLTDVDQINITADAGDDLVTITNIDKKVDTNGGDGTADRLIIVGHPAANNFTLDTAKLTVNGFDYTFSNLESLRADGQAKNDQFSVTAFPPSTPVIFNGAGGIDTLTGPNLVNTWAITAVNGGTLDQTVNMGVVTSGVAFANIENLTGNAQADTFTFGAGKAIADNIDGGGGADTLDYSAYKTPVTYSQSKPTIGLATGTGGVTNIEQIIGGSASDTIVGPLTTGTTNWNFSGTNGVNLSAVGFSIIDFLNFENLSSRSTSDKFVFNNGATWTGKIAGGSGSKNELDFSAYTTGVSVNLQSSSYSAAGAGTFSKIQIFTGPTNAAAAKNSNLFGPNKNLTWSIKGTNSGTVNGITFNNFGHLTGGSLNDTFLFFDGKNVTGLVDGGSGTDILNYSAYSTAISVNLTTNAATGTGGIANLEGVIGTSLTTDSLTGPSTANTANTWTLTGDSKSNVNGFTFSAIDNLIGSAEQDDTFVMTKGKVFAGTIDGGNDPTPASASFNTLDYSGYTTDVTVDLSGQDSGSGLGTATNITGGVSHITDVLGGSGNDNLKGDSKDNFLRGNGGNDTIDGGANTSGGDILIGDAGNDKITGGAGNDLLFGGTGADTLSGGAGNDLLFNGTTSFDSNATTINSIHTFWIGVTDANFATRVASLRAGSATGVSVALNSTNVFDDTSADTLTGGAGVNALDWFFAKLAAPAQDTITDLTAGEATN